MSSTSAAVVDTAAHLGSDDEAPFAELADLAGEPGGTRKALAAEDVSVASPLAAPRHVPKTRKGIFRNK